MSWQATAWAVGQQVGPPARKLLLLVLANYADEHGICWPSQETLSRDTGMSLDTVQRQTKKLREAGLLTVTRAPKRRGQWQTFVYQLSLSLRGAGPQSAARRVPGGRCETFSGNMPNFEVGSRSSDRDQAPGSRNDSCGSAGPQEELKPSRTAVRFKPSIKPSIEPSRTQTPTKAAARLEAFRANQEATEVTQNRIASRLGPEGWLLLGELSEDERERLTSLERRRQLDDATLARITLSVHLPRPP